VSGLPSFATWLRRWGASLASLALGLWTLFVFRRGTPHVALMVGYLLLLWLLVAVAAEIWAPEPNRRRRFVLTAVEYAIQTLYHNLLLFVLPAYWAASTLTSPNGGFVAAVVLAALLTAIDPWYMALVHRWTWVKHALLAFSVFAALNVALPLVGVRPFGALMGSAALAALGLTPALRRHMDMSWQRAATATLVLAAAAVGLVWYGRAAVPPAPLFLARAVAARDVASLEPVEIVPGAVPEATVRGWGGIAAYTAVYAPAGLRQSIAHVWRRDGEVVARIPLVTVQGGRQQGFRTWSRRTDLRGPLVGHYTVDVLTASGQLIGRLQFHITP